MASSASTDAYHSSQDAIARWQNPEHEEITKPPAIERCKIAYWADKLGYIPLIGTVVGVARIVCGVVAGIFSALATLAILVSCRGDLEEKCFYITGRSLDECTRGFVELIPGCSYYSDCAKEKWEKEKGRLTEDRGAYGRYLFASPPTHGGVVYSQEMYDGQILWQSRRVENEVRGVNGYKQPLGLASL